MTSSSRAVRAGASYHEAAQDGAPRSRHVRRRCNAFQAGRPRRSLRLVKVMSVLPLLGVLSCGCDAPSGPQGAATSSTAGAAATPQGCASLAAHWREVWAAESKPGMERRARRAADLAVADWSRGCAEVAAAP